MNSANKFRKEKEITTEVDGSVGSENEGYTVDACSRYIAEESDATNLLLQGSRAFSEIIDSHDDVGLTKSDPITRQISSKEQSLQKVDEQSSIEIHPLCPAALPPLVPAGPPPPDTVGMPPPDTVGMPPLGHAGMPPLGHAGMPPLGNAGMPPLGNAGMPPLGHARLTPVPHAGFRPLRTAEVHSKATRQTVKKESLKILGDLTSVYNETCRSKTELPAFLQEDVVELVERIRFYFSYMQEKLEIFCSFYAVFYIELSRMHTTPETQQEIDSIRRICSTSLIRVKTTQLSCQTVSKIFETFNKQHVSARVNKVYEKSAEVVRLMGEELIWMRTVISNYL